MTLSVCLLCLYPQEPGDIPTSVGANDEGNQCYDDGLCMDAADEASVVRTLFQGDDAAPVANELAVAVNEVAAVMTDEVVAVANELAVVADEVAAVAVDEVAAVVTDELAAVVANELAVVTNELAVVTDEVAAAVANEVAAVVTDEVAAVGNKVSRLE